MSTNIKHRLKDYQYPDVVFEVISKFVDTVLNVLNQEKIGVLLLGSTSRGELCWGMNDGKVTIFSDIEFIVAADSVPSERKKDLFQKVKKLADSYDLGDRFHLDYVINSWASLSKVQKRLLIFDCKNTGLDLTINTVKEKLPEVNRGNLDFKELNDVLLHRMKALINDVPDDVFDKGIHHRDFVLSIAKNTLDITTWLFPYEAEKLVSGFEPRINNWDEKRSELKLNNYFDEDDFAFLHECLSIRKMPINNYDGNELLKKCLIIFGKAIDYCKAMNGIDSDNAIDNNFVSSQLFSEFKIRRRLAEAYQIFSHCHLFSIENCISNMFLPRKGKQAQFCFTMVQAIVENSSHPNKKNSYLTKAKKELNNLLKVQNKNSGKFSDDWMALRREYTMLNKIFI